jgi:hypothetical protein
MLILGVNPRKASKLVMMGKATLAVKNEKLEYRPGRIQSRKWARYLFFGMGALPAASLHPHY